MNIHIHNWHKDILYKTIPNQENLNILDLGCGYGRNSMTLLERNDKINITGVDISENYITQFKKNTNQQGIVSTLEDLSSDIGKYDYIICIAVLMYVESKNAESVINKLLSLLNKNGKIIFIEPSISAKPFLNCFGILNLYTSKRKLTGGNFLKTKDFKNNIINAGGIVVSENRFSFTTIFVIPIFLICSIFRNNKMESFMKIISKVDNKIRFLKLPTIHISLIVEPKKSFHK